MIKSQRFGGILNSPWNYNSHETTTFGCSNSTSWGPKAVTALKWRLLHRAIYWEVAVALTTAAKLQKVRANSREMTSQKLNEEHEILRRFMAVVVSSAFRDSLTFPRFQDRSVFGTLRFRIADSVPQRSQPFQRCCTWRGFNLGNFHRLPAWLMQQLHRNPLVNVGELHISGVRFFLCDT